MWKQKPEDPTFTSHVHVPDPLRPVVARHAETIAPVQPVASPAGHSSIGKGITVRGEISGADGLYLDGTVEGTICIPGERVTVGREGRVIAPHSARSAPCIRAREIVILGAVMGNVEAEDRVDMRAQASLTGDVSTRRVSIEDGAYFRGGIDILRDTAPREGSAVNLALAGPQQQTADATVAVNA